MDFLEEKIHIYIYILIFKPVWIYYKPVFIGKYKTDNTFLFLFIHVLIYEINHVLLASRGYEYDGFLFS
jgi:hypothetical protein